jgi:hypothetical protein
LDAAFIIYTYNKMSQAAIIGVVALMMMSSSVGAVALMMGGDDEKKTGPTGPTGPGPTDPCAGLTDDSLASSVSVECCTKNFDR